MDEESERLTIIPNDYTSLFKPLNASRKEFRYVIVEPPLPGQPQQMISCILLHASLHDDPIPAYEGLSHYWEDADNTTTICLRSPPILGAFKESGWPISLCEQDFNVTVVLEEALFQLRRSPEEGGRCLWIDAICINQTDLDERS